MIAGILEKLASGPGAFILLGILAFFGLVAIVVVAVVASERARVRVAEVRADLVRDMIHRGMSAEEIERVLAAGVADPEPKSGEDRYAEVGPAACDVAVEDEDGEWHRALLLHMRGDTCLVHYVGQDVGETEMVGRSRVRFPSSVAFDEADRAEWPEDDFAREATVERDGEWLPAYVLMRLDRTYVHYVGTDWSENEWVDEARIRVSGRPADRTGKGAKPSPHELEV